MGWLSGLIKGGSDELGWDDLIRRVVAAIAQLAHDGAKGARVFPPAVIVKLEVAEGSVAVVQGFVDDPRFDREVGAGVANRCDVAATDLPLRSYVVAAADEVAVIAEPGAVPGGLELLIEGGDRAGAVLPLPPGRTELTFGRGEWHGGPAHVRNDLVVCEKNDFVSRRAGRLFRVARMLEVEALDQRDLLLVRRASGEVLRPARTARGRVAVGAGDVIELADGRGDAVRLVVRATEK